MRAIIRVCVCVLLGLAFIANSLPCGPGYISPLFDTSSAPENPYTDFAAGRLGILKPTFHRSVLFAAYRYIAGNGLTGDEQKAVIDVWNAEINNKGFADEPIDETVKAWVAKRAEIVGKEENPPEIYAERSYGGYDFFPNCTKNAFETATETLTDRAGSHGPTDPNVQQWVKAQDDVFENCSQGKQTPIALPAGAPDWLQKDHAYQVAAAEFYGMDYETAKKHFTEIAGDVDSPWQQTADYLVVRTLIRQASLTKSPDKSNKFYEEAEARLQRFVSGGKFSASAERLEGLVEYRLRPKERVSALAKKLSFFGGNENFRQDLIDYTWLLDKFENEILTAEQKRKEAEEAKKHPANANVAPPETTTEPNTNSVAGKKNDDDLEINLYAENQTYTIFVPSNASDADAIAAMEKVVGKPLTDDEKSSVKATRQGAYAGLFTNAKTPDYEGGYWGEEKMTRSLMPAYIRQDPLSDWLYTYQMKGADAYLYALKQFKEGGSELWLMTALSKADKASTELPRLLEAANNASRTSPAYITIAYHAARILLSQGKTDEAKKLVEDMLNTGDQLPISAQNSFVALRLQLADSMEDFLKDSLRKPFAFDWDGQTATIDQIIAEEKSYYDPEYSEGKTKEQYDAEIEDNYKDKREWQNRSMFDDSTIDVFNQHFPTAKLIEVEQSPALPDHLRERFAMAIWVRAFLLDDLATLVKVNAELARLHPELQDDLAKVAASKTQASLDHSVLFLILKHPELTPYLEGGLGREDDEQDQWSGDDWWCAPYETEYNDETGTEQPTPLPPKPKFLTAAQSQLAQNEHKRLKAIGDAPKYLGNKVLEWAKASPADKRIPEALYIVIGANGWTKYGCGNDEDLKKELETYLKKHYPSSPFIKKLAEDEEGTQ